MQKNQKSLDTQVYANPIEQKFENNLVLHPTDHEKEFYENQSESVDNYNEMIKAFEDSNISTYSLNQKQQSENEKYPDYYGGAYIDEETGGLVVLVKENASDLKSAATEIAAITKETTTISSKSIKDGIRIESCDVSLNEIEDAIDFLSNQIRKLQIQKTARLMQWDMHQKLMAEVRELSVGKAGVLVQLDSLQNRETDMVLLYQDIQRLW